MLGRYSSEIRTGCANERPSGSVRGAPGNWCPYRDRQLTYWGSKVIGFLAGICSSHPTFSAGPFSTPSRARFHLACFGLRWR